jgi:hypothetical protein
MTKEEKIKELDKQIKEIEDKLNDPNLAQGSAFSYTRVSGYYRQGKAMNRAKRKEIRERLTYDAGIGTESKTQNYGIFESDYSQGA